MTFKSSNKEKSIPLIEETANDLLSDIQKKFLEFSRDYDEINDYCKNLTNYGKVDYNRRKNNVTAKIKVLPENCKNLHNLIFHLSKLEIKDLSLRKKVKDQLDVVKDKLLQKEKEVPRILNNILDKENIVTKRLGIEESDMDLSNMSAGNNVSNLDKYRESKIVLHEVIDNNEYLQKRQEQLEDIKKVASQVKEMSHAMGKEVAKTGEDLNRLEDIVIDANENAKKAENEIKEADKDTRSMTKKILCLSMIIVFVIVSIVLLFYFIFK